MLKIGVGFDLPWLGPSESVRAGFGSHPDHPERVHPAVARTWARHGFETGFVSWQPRDRRRLDVRRYEPAFADLRARIPGELGLHHTALNLASPERTDRRALLAFTNALIRTCDFRWVNEDLGLWSIGGRPLPYPWPPLLTDGGISACVRNIREVAAGLDAPLLVEFPGFDREVAPWEGSMDAYDHFAEVITRGGTACALDTAHLLSWRWSLGHRGDALYGDLDRLPLDQVEEIHMSGCMIAGDRLFDAHHGVLLDEQLALLERLVGLCPGLKRVIYEDPKPDRDGGLSARATPGFERLRAIVAASSEDGRRAAAEAVDPRGATRDGGLSGAGAGAGLAGERREAEVVRAMDRAARAGGEPADAIAGMVSRRVIPGVGRLKDAFPRTLSEIPDAIARFVASEAYERWREVPWEDGGLSLEEAFAAFAAGIVDPTLVRTEAIAASARALVADPAPTTGIPPGWVRTDDGSGVRGPDGSFTAVIPGPGGRRVVHAPARTPAAVLAESSGVPAVLAAIARASSRDTAAVAG